MSKIASSILDLVGNTPLVEVNRVATALSLKARLLLKVESFNPAGSVKDRVAEAMIVAAESAGTLRAGGTIVEPTSGNTGVGLALAAAVRGYRLVVVMPETMSIERRRLVAAYGAEVVLTPGVEGMKGAIAKAEELRQTIEGAVTLGQFDNPANPLRHQTATAEEIWRDTAGRVDVFVAGVGTGGTISGVGRGLKSHNPAVQVVAVEPESSPVLSGGAPSPHKIQGIGAGFVPRNYCPEVVDRIVSVSNDAAFEHARLLARTEGVLVGISSGAAFAAALSLAKEADYAGKTIVVLLPDTGERYLSTPLFD
ncbi:cysteine synthase A [Alloprevotella sp. OH1205_COT-284]|uniref:cysteine synthase A n=1 Tax=Alloprevotella sp. OH1205_COT-284 TaxID=2491043 RepID=UPI000F5E6C34|nr:cysteine synthase A [Alloprevotella sp. OH1205_COT-284]RRD79783.1 cysteine synthase A [Alloprevotella sp. OH1205_COT-284]